MDMSTFDLSGRVAIVTGGGMGIGQRLALGKEAVVVPTELGRVRVYAEGKLLGTANLQEYAILAPERLIAAQQ